MTRPADAVPSQALHYEPRIVQCARIAATVAHKGQTDKAGKPYIHHPERVAFAVKQNGASAEAQAVAWLHDVLEDTSVSVDDLLAWNLPLDVIRAVAALTRRKDETNENYYWRVRGNELALLVKTYDIADNSDPRRLAMLDAKTRTRLESKYAKAREALGIACA